LTTLILGTVVSLSTGACQLKGYPSPEFWPHYLLLSFYLFVALTVLMIVVSWFTQKQPEQGLPTLRESYAQGQSPKTLWRWWGVLAAIMGGLYVFFN